MKIKKYNTKAYGSSSSLQRFFKKVIGVEKFKTEKLTKTCNI